jgi:hypothetical protein
MSALINLVSVEFRKAPPAYSIGRLMLGDCWIRWDSVMRAHIFSDRLAWEEALQIFVVCCHHGTCLLRSMVKSGAENDMEAMLWGLATAVWVYVVMRNFLGDSWLVSMASISGDDNIGDVQSPTLQGENPMLGLNWLCPTMVLLKSLFYDSGLFPWWKPMIYDRQRRLLCIVSSLVSFLLEKLDFLCCLGGVCTIAARNRSP